MDADGDPVKLASISKVRVYSSAVLDTTSSTPTFTVPGLFGETSAEVCGIYSVSGGGGDVAGGDLIIVDAETEESEFDTENMTVQEFAAGSYVLYSEADHVFVNGISVDASSGYTLTLSSGDVVQIITQSGTASSYITVIKCS